LLETGKALAYEDVRIADPSRQVVADTFPVVDDPGTAPCRALVDCKESKVEDNLDSIAERWMDLLIVPYSLQHSGDEAPDDIAGTAAQVVREETPVIALTTG